MDGFSRCSPILNTHTQFDWVFLLFTSSVLGSNSTYFKCGMFFLSFEFVFLSSPRTSIENYVSFSSVFRSIWYLLSRNWMIAISKSVKLVSVFTKLKLSVIFLLPDDSTQSLGRFNRFIFFFFSRLFNVFRTEND